MGSKSSSILFALLYANAAVISAPLATAVRFSGDEGYELTKAYLASLGYPLYSQVWSDQPPLHTAILSALFSVTGPDVFTARLLAVAFTALLLAAFVELVRWRAGSAAAWIAGILLLISPDFCQLSVSAVIVIPAIAVGLVSVLLLVCHLRSGHRHWLILSGVAMGLGLQIKFTSALMLPAMALEFWMSQHRMGSRAAFRQGLVWLISSAVTFVLVLFCFPGSTFDLLWSTHFSEQTRSAFADSRDATVMHRLLIADWPTLIAAGVGLVWLGVDRDRGLRFPLTLLVTVYFAHLWQRPFWSYYYFHFAIPLSWLGAVAVVAPLRRLNSWDWEYAKRHRVKAMTALVLWSLACASVVTDLPYRLQRAERSVTAARPVSDDPVIGAITEYDGLHWIFSDRNCDAFFAQVPVPPELAVVSQKRTRSGRLPPAELARILSRYQPELIIIRSEASPAIERLLDKGYSLDRQVESAVFFRRRPDHDQRRQ